jgi:hypothetical protein
MGRFAVNLVAGLALLAGQVGCALLSSHSREDEPRAPDLPTLSLPPIQRTNMEARFSPGFSPLAHPPAHPLEKSYQAMTAEQCRCRAVQVQGTANMLDASAASLGEELARKFCPELHDQARQVALKQDVLRSNAQELRNSNAAVALNLFFRIVEAEALTDLEQESLRAVDEALYHMLDLKNKGLKSNEDYEALRRQRLEMLAEATRLQLATDEFNTELTRLLELDGSCHCNGRFWPIFTPHLDAEIPECKAAVAEGLARRPELFMIKRIADELDAKTLLIIAKMLQGVNGLLGPGDSKSHLAGLAQLVAIVCGSGPLAREVETRRQQVNTYRNSRTAVIAGEIRQDVIALGHRAQLVVLVRQRVESLQTTLEDVLAKDRRGMANFAQILEARLQLHKARAEFVREATAWERERVQLAWHQGVLFLDCREGGKGACVVDQGATPGPIMAVKHETAFSTQLGRVLSQAPAHGKD